MSTRSSKCSGAEDSTKSYALYRPQARGRQSSNSSNTSSGSSIDYQSLWTLEKLSMKAYEKYMNPDTSLRQVILHLNMIDSIAEERRRQRQLLAAMEDLSNSSNGQVKGLLSSRMISSLVGPDGRLVYPDIVETDESSSSDMNDYDNDNNSEYFDDFEDTEDMTDQIVSSIEKEYPTNLPNYNCRNDYSKPQGVIIPGDIAFETLDDGNSPQESGNTDNEPKYESMSPPLKTPPLSDDGNYSEEVLSSPSSDDDDISETTRLLSSVQHVDLGHIFTTTQPVKYSNNEHAPLLTSIVTSQTDGACKTGKFSFYSWLLNVLD